MTGEISPGSPGWGRGHGRAISIQSPGNREPDDDESPRQRANRSGHARARRTDMYSIGLEREIAKPMTASVAYVHKNGRDFIGWNDIRRRVQRGVDRTVNGVTIPMYVLQRRRVDQAIQPRESAGLLADLRRIHRDGRETSLTRLVRQRVVHAVESLRPATLRRNNGGRRASGDDGRSTCVICITRDVRPGSEFADERRRPPAERPAESVSTDGLRRRATHRHHCRRQRSVLHREAVGEHRRHHAVTGAGRDSRVARGARHAEAVVADRARPRVSKAFAIGAAGRVELRFDILNLFNDTAEESMRRIGTTVPTYNVGNVFLDPRRVMLSVKVNLGK